MTTPRDGRPGRFWVDNDVLDEYARRIGVHAYAVYTALARHADANGMCYPSTGTLADELDISRPTVSKAIHTLEGAGLIDIKERKLAVRGQTSHVYTLRQISKTAVKEIDTGRATAVNAVDRPCKPPLHPPVNGVYSPINKTQFNKTQLSGDVEARLEALGLYPSQVRTAIAAAVGSRHEFSLDDVAVCEAYVARELPTFPKAVAALHNQYLRLGKLPPAASTNGHRNGSATTKLPDQPDLHWAEDDEGPYLALADGSRYEVPNL